MAQENLVALAPQIITLGHDLVAFKVKPLPRYYVGMAALLAYDYCLTIGQELEEIWTGNRSLIFYLYVVNRYCPMAVCVITLFGHFSPLWTAEVCARFAIVKWFQTLLVIIPAETVLLIRTFTLTNHNRPIAIFLVSVMIFQCFVVFYAVSRRGQNRALATPFELGDSDPYHACILFSEPRMDTAYLGVTILFDFTVFASTILRTLTFRPKEILPTTVLLRTILRDGVLYFAVILSGNVVWMICALTGRRGIKLINAQPSLLLTSIMITRLTLSLRRAGQKNDNPDGITHEWQDDTLTTAPLPDGSR